MLLRILKRMFLTLLAIFVLLISALLIFLSRPHFGKAPSGERLERIKKSPNYKNGKFENREFTYQFNPDKGFAQAMWEFFTVKTEGLRPAQQIPVINTNLKTLDKSIDQLIWFGHSSYYMILDGKSFLVDPVFLQSSPIRYFNKPFAGTQIYSPQHFPEIDYLVITHDHWDHLDYKTFLELEGRTKKIITSLGVGSHLEHWGCNPSKIIELDWDEKALLDSGFTVYCFTARHFSGRSFGRNNTLWSSFVLETPNRKIYIGGDSGYGTHFKTIGEKFPQMDLAIIENGQYNPDWFQIHIMPEELPTAIQDIGAKQVLTVHNSKFALARHAWHDPMEKIYEASLNKHIHLATPVIGEIVRIGDSAQVFEPWWKGLK